VSSEVNITELVKCSSEKLANNLDTLVLYLVNLH